MIITHIASTAVEQFGNDWGNYLLKELIETQSPPPISWLPQTLGWKLLGLACLLFIFRKSYLSYKSYQNNAYRRDALKWLAMCEAKNDLTTYKQLPALLRKTALTAFHRQDITQLNGKAWEQWLDQQCHHTNFTTLCPNALQQLAYMPGDKSPQETDLYRILIEQSKLWVKYHRRFDV